MNTYTQDVFQDGLQDTLYTTSFQPFKKAAKRRSTKSSNEECKRGSSKLGRKGIHKQEWAKVRSGKRDANRDWEE